MVDLDLRELSAPLEGLRPEVDAAYQRLDAKWKAIGKQLQRLPIPCTVGCVIDEDPHNPDNYVRLEWLKWKGSRRVCIVTYYYEHTPNGPEEASHVTPYDEWSGDQRVNMLEHVPALFDAAVKQTKAFIERTRE